MVPEVTIEPETFVEVETCGDAVLKCTATSFRNVAITWKRLYKDLPETTEFSTTKSLNQRVSIITIKKAAWYHKGDYYCVAKNDVGEVNSSIVHINITGELISLGCYSYKYLLLNSSMSKNGQPTNACNCSS